MALSAAQRAAVECDAACPLQILAGPGSGKTRVLTMRVAWLVDGSAAHATLAPERCVVVTFTNKAANEMRTRLYALIGVERTQKLVLGTFHATCAQYLRRYGRRIGIDANFTIADTDDAKRVLKEVLDASPDLPLKPEQALSEISRAKARSQTPERVRQGKDRALFADVYAAYQAKLRASNALDFDDLLMYGAQLFRSHPSVSKDIAHGMYPSLIRPVLVDEFQDTNAVQYELMRLMASASGHVSVVGDPDQSIYSWRNAEVGNLEKMHADFPGLRRVLLEENYRSTQAILDASIKVMRQDPYRIDKGLYTSQGSGAPVAFHTFSTAEEEAEYIALEIQRNIQLTSPLLTYADVCILLRFNALSRMLEGALQRHGIPYRVMGGPKFFDRAEVKDLLAYLLLVDNPAYTPALLRIANVPRRGIGAKTVQDLQARAAQHRLSLYACMVQLVEGNAALGAGVRPTVVQALGALMRTLQRLRDAAHEGMAVADLLQLLLTEIDFRAHLQREEDAESRWENVQELISFASSCDVSGTESGDAPPAKRMRTTEAVLATPLRTFLENSMLASDTAAGVEANDKVTISTCHAAKGLEWPVVFVPAVEDGIFPFYRSVSPDELREERRLLYVAMTRAATNLYLSATQRRLVAGEWQSRNLSMFLAPLVPKTHRGTLSMPVTHAVPWCFHAPDLQQAMAHTASVLQRTLPDPSTCAANEAAFRATPAARRLALLESSSQLAPSCAPCTHERAPPHPRTSGGFASALNALSSSALTGSGHQGNMQVSHPPPSQLARAGRSLGVRRSVPGLAGVPRTPSLRDGGGGSRAAGTTASGSHAGPLPPTTLGVSGARPRPRGTPTLGVARRWGAQRPMPPDKRL